MRNQNFVSRDVKRPRLMHFALLALLLLIGGCINPSGVAQRKQLRFVLVDVGQGLSQIAVCDCTALVWDMGDSSARDNWEAVYTRLGSPRVAAVVISHGDRDHAQGLGFIDAIERFSGTIVISPVEDSLVIERYLPEHFEYRVRRKGQGDTIGGLPGALVECLWPPHAAAGVAEQGGALRNRLSLCCKLTYNANSVLMTGDIDTTAARALVDCYGSALASDIFVVPHHGSRASHDPLLAGLVSPAAALISCGAGNGYGHPDSAVVAFLSRALGAVVHITSISGDYEAVSNGYYWMRQ